MANLDDVLAWANRRKTSSAPSWPPRPRPSLDNLADTILVLHAAAELRESPPWIADLLAALGRTSGSYADALCEVQKLREEHELRDEVKVCARCALEDEDYRQRAADHARRLSDAGRQISDAIETIRATVRRG